DNYITEIHAGDLPPQLSNVDFSDNPIATIDETAFDQSTATLNELQFSGVHFKEVPLALLHLTSLKTLIIQWANILVWREDIMKHLCSTLELLVLDNVGLTSWPTWIQYCLHLTTLQLSSGVLTNMPDNALDNLTNITSLNLENASLVTFPKSVSKLTLLTELTLDSNNISQVTGLDSLTSLITLSMMNNKLSDGGQLSNALRPLAASLQVLQLNGNKLTAFPDLVFLQKLQEVYLTNNRIFNIGFSQIPSSLTNLDFENNFVQSLYAFMQTGDNLMTVRFDYNSISDIRGVDITPSVRDVYISHNLITRISDTAFPENSSMEILILDYNPIISISLSAFSNLKKLTYLSLMSTKLSRLSVAFTALAKLETLDMRENSVLVCTCLEKSLRPWAQSESLRIFGDCGPTSIVDFLVGLSVGCPE
ncbi:unnamed protein product, partial [Candidula unifasciata]